MGREGYITKKCIRQYIGLLSSVLAYYAVHEGAHSIYALSTGVFRQINFMGIGMQIGIYEEQMSDTGLGILWAGICIVFDVFSWVLIKLRGA